MSGNKSKLPTNFTYFNCVLYFTILQMLDRTFIRVAYSTVYSAVISCATTTYSVVSGITICTLHYHFLY